MIHSLTLITPMIVLLRYIIIIIAMLFYCNSAYANNSTYITLSNQIARKTQLAMVANNVANANTTGYEADNVLFKNIDTRQNALILLYTLKAHTKMAIVAPCKQLIVQWI